MQAKNTDYFSRKEHVTDLQGISHEETILQWRAKELEIMTKFDSQEGYAGIIVCGQRQVGKTYFLTEFYKQKRHLYFQAIMGSSAENFRELQSAIRNADFLTLLSEEQKLAFKTAEDFISLLALVLDTASVLDFTLVIDEYNYLCEQFEGISTILQKYIDKIQRAQQTNFKLVLCGSNIGILKRVTAYEGPLFGRINYELVFTPVSVVTVARYLQFSDSVDSVKAAILTGGLPVFILAAAKAGSFDNFVNSVLLNPVSTLRRYPLYLLRINRIDSTKALSIIEAILAGASKWNDIKTSVNFENDFDQVINALVDCGYLTIHKPILSRQKSEVYHIANSAVEFLCKFHLTGSYEEGILPQISLGDLASQEISDFFGKYFEQFCRQFVMEQSYAIGVLQPPGYWEDNIRIDSHNTQMEIDVIAESYNHEHLLVGECKFKTQPIGIRVFKDLKDKAQYVSSHASDRVYCLFSKSGFTEELRQLARTESNIILYTLGDMLGADLHK